MADPFTTADKIAENAILKILARGVMVLLLPTSIYVVGYVNGLGLSIADHDKRLALSEVRAEANATAINSIDTRMLALDNRTVLILQAVARLEATAGSNP